MPSGKAKVITNIHADVTGFGTQIGEGLIERLRIDVARKITAVLFPKLFIMCATKRVFTSS